ncbi:MAG: alpha/beta hydrolase [Pseudomonadota bacterium]
MRVRIAPGLRLWFDVEGAGLVPDGPRMREKPTLILLHGGPGADHSIYKPGFGALSDLAQVIYLDHRGNGRSDLGDPADWTLARWGDDVAAFCDALGIARPVVFGASFGGLVAQAFALRHPGRARALILASTAARHDFEAVYDAFGRIGGPEARAAAEGYWGAPTAESRALYHKVCLPLYARAPVPADWASRIEMRNDVALHFNGPGNEQGRFDFREALAGLDCPLLLMAGEDDPVMPAALSDEIAASVPSAHLRYERFAGARHMLGLDAPEAMMAAIRGFLEGLEAEGETPAEVGTGA